MDPDNGDEAYDLTTDPKELRNLTNLGLPPLPDEFAVLQTRLHAFQNECAKLRAELGIVQGDRGFFEGWE